jgi:hypothetical protein
MSTSNSSTLETLVDGVQHARDRPLGSQQWRKVNRNATRARLNELGFIGAGVKMATRDYALIDLSPVPQKRREVAETYFENTEGYYPEPDVDGYQWGSRL